MKYELSWPAMDALSKFLASLEKLTGEDREKLAEVTPTFIRLRLYADMKKEAESAD